MDASLAVDGGNPVVGMQFHGVKLAASEFRNNFVGSGCAGSSMNVDRSGYSAPLFARLYVCPKRYFAFVRIPAIR